MKNNNLAKIQWKKLFPSLNIATDQVLSCLLNSSRLISLEKDDVAFSSGASCHHYLLLTEGQIRVQLLTHSGRQVVLYHVNPGDDCVLTTSCLFAGDCYPAEGIVIKNATAIAIPAHQFHSVIEDSMIFRQFVFSTFSKRLTEVIMRMELSYSSSVEKLLVQKLLMLGSHKAMIKITHQNLACEIGTVREVVSRRLKKIEKKGWIKMGRGNIELINYPKLLQFSLI